VEDDDRMRPIERRMVKLAEAGAADVEIAWRFRRTPKYVRQVMACAHLRRENGTGSLGPLRPIERRLLQWRDQGADFADLAARFRRRPESLQQIERLARYKLAR
jgi:hypothetical protein